MRYTITHPCPNSDGWMGKYSSLYTWTWLIIHALIAILVLVVSVSKKNPWVKCHFENDISNVWTNFYFSFDKKFQQNIPLGCHLTITQYNCADNCVTLRRYLNRCCRSVRWTLRNKLNAIWIKRHTFMSQSCHHWQRWKVERTFSQSPQTDWTRGKLFQRKL